MITCSAATKGASSSTYITASAKREATSESAETTGLRWRITTNANITAIAAKKKKTAYSIIAVSRPSSAASRHLLPAGGEKDLAARALAPRERGEGGRRPGEG